MIVSKPQTDLQTDDNQHSAFDGIVVNKDPLTLSDGTDEIVLPDAEIEAALGHRVSISGGILVDKDALDNDRDRSATGRSPATDHDRIPYRERGDGQPVTAWRFAPESKRGTRQ